MNRRECRCGVAIPVGWSLCLKCQLIHNKTGKPLPIDRNRMTLGAGSRGGSLPADTAEKTILQVTGGVKTREYCQAHTIRRAKERYNLTMTTKNYDELCIAAKELLDAWAEDLGGDGHDDDSAPVVESCGDDTQRVFPLYFMDTWVIPTWSDNRDCVTTFLPLPRSPNA